MDPVLGPPPTPRGLRLIVIAPLAYRLRKGSKLLYRRPAFLLCTEENLDPQVVIETYRPALGHRG